MERERGYVGWWGVGRGREEGFLSPPSLTETLDCMLEDVLIYLGQSGEHRQYIMHRETSTARDKDARTVKRQLIERKCTAAPHRACAPFIR